MPQKPIDYSKTYFYKIVCNDLEVKDCYVGHTTDFTKRKSQHKTSCTNPSDKHHAIPVYCFIRENGGWLNWSMLLIEEQSFNSSLEARRQEREYIEQLNATLNLQLPTRTNMEYRHDKCDQIKAKQQEYNKINHTVIAQKSKIYREKNKEKLSEMNRVYREKNSEELKDMKHKYYDENQNVIKEKAKDYYYQHLDQIKARRSQKKACIKCGKEISIYKLKRHQLSSNCFKD